ncbi:MAG: hypothetical protein QME59_03345 [Candidatus Hydrothermarchaeota archaeon]|nr:hypothetical protein [Candidatus Hydrothermarchaeota archaeon]
MPKKNMDIKAVRKFDREAACIHIQKNMEVTNKDSAYENAISSKTCLVVLL